MNSDEDFDTFDILEVSEHEECTDLMEITLENLELYDFNINNHNQNGDTLLHIFARKGKFNLCKRVIDLGISINSPNFHNETPLHLACLSADLSIIQLLLANGAKTQILNKANEDILLYAIKNSQYQEIIAFFAKTTPEIFTSSLLQRAILENSHEKITFLLGLNLFKLDKSILWTVRGNFPAEIVQILLEANASNENNIREIIDTNSAKLPSLLHVSVENQNFEVTKLLIHSGCNLDAQDSDGSTPLHYAIQLHLRPFCFLLLNNGAKVNVQDSDGYTPLHLACTLRNCDFVKVLLQYKAGDVQIKTNNGDLPLHLAASYGRTETVRVLLENDNNSSGNKNTENFDKVTPLQLAQANQHDGVVKLLQKRKIPLIQKKTANKTVIGLLKIENL